MGFGKFVTIVCVWFVNNRLYIDRVGIYRSKSNSFFVQCVNHILIEKYTILKLVFVSIWEFFFPSFLSLSIALHSCIHNWTEVDRKSFFVLFSLFDRMWNEFRIIFGLPSAERYADACARKLNRIPLEMYRFVVSNEINLKWFNNLENISKFCWSRIICHDRSNLR